MQVCIIISQCQEAPNEPFPSEPAIDCETEQVQEYQKQAQVLCQTHSSPCAAQQQHGDVILAPVFVTPNKTAPGPSDAQQQKG
jgi:hypothetical protein